MEHDFTCVEEEPPLVERFRTSHHLYVDHCQVPSLIARPYFPQLECLQIGTTTRNHEHQTPMGLDCLLHSMEQPNLEKLVLRDIRLTKEDKQPKSNYPEIENMNSLCHIQILELQQTCIEFDTLAEIFRTCRDLRSFTLTRPMDNRGGILLYDLVAALCTLSRSLHTLALGYHAGHKLSEISVLPSLRALMELRHLKIDPSMFLGRRLCPH